MIFFFWSFKKWFQYIERLKTPSTVAGLLVTSLYSKWSVNCPPTVAFEKVDPLPKRPDFYFELAILTANSTAICEEPCRNCLLQGSGDIRAITTNPPASRGVSVGKHTLPGCQPHGHSLPRSGEMLGVVPIQAAVGHEAEDAAWHLDFE